MKKVAFTLLLAMVVVLATATIVERFYGTATAQSTIYHSVPFALLWLGIAVTAFAHIMRVKLYRRLPSFAVHVALLLILAGAATTWLTGYSGKMRLSRDECKTTLTDDKGVSHKLPFSVTLPDYQIEYYDGTHSPADFVSKIRISSPTDEDINATVRMNQIASHQGYRFYQMGFDTENDATVLQVTHDPWGIAITYSGYLLLAISLIAVLWWRRGHFRALLKQLSMQSSCLIAIMMLCCVPAQAETTAPETVTSEVAERFGNLFVLYNGRIAPVQTLARDFTIKLYGKPTYRGFTAEQVLAGWIFYFDQWRTQPMIKVKSGHARELLGIQGRYASMDDYRAADNSYRLDHVLALINSGASVDDARGINEAHEKYELTFMAATGQLLKLFPVRQGAEISWFTPGSRDLPENLPEDQWVFLRRGMDYLTEMVITHDQEGACHFLEKLREYQVKECGTALPSDTQFKAEKLYNQINSSRWLAMMLVTLGIVLIVVSVRNTAKGRKLPQWVRMVGICALTVTAAYLVTCVALRWIVSGHVPMSNGFETMQTMSLASALLTLWLHSRHSNTLGPGVLVTGLTLMVSMLGESNPAITPLMPVLHSPWLSIHVATIMIAYSLLALMALNSIMALLSRHQPSVLQRLHVLNMVMLYPAVALLAIGIFIGAVWANVSWGTYWSWDPKEVWALITLIVYALPIHSQSIKRFTSPVFTHAYIALAFLSVLITYFGVNYFLGGMHSYA